MNTETNSGERAILIAVARIATVKFHPKDEATNAIVGELLVDLCRYPQCERQRPRPRADPHCANCEGSGIRIVERGNLSGATRCECLSEPVGGKVWTSEEQVEWLSKRFVELRIPWTDGLNELRAVYGSKFKPPDGKDAFSEAYPDGIPSERTQEHKQLPAAPQKRLTAAEATADPEMGHEIARLGFRQSGRRIISAREDLDAIRHLYTEEEYQAAVARLEKRGAS